MTSVNAGAVSLDLLVKPGWDVADVYYQTLSDRDLAGVPYSGRPTSCTVYVPKGRWYDVRSDEVVAGPAEIEAKAPIERMPIFVRAGAVIPLAPPLRYVGERPIEKLALHIYPPLPPTHSDFGSPAKSAARVSLLYEDDGESFAFQEGSYRLTRFCLASEPRPLRQLRLRRTIEGAYASPCGAFDVIFHGLTAPPTSVTQDGEEVPTARKNHDRATLRVSVDAFKDLRLTWS